MNIHIFSLLTLSHSLTTAAVGILQKKISNTTTLTDYFVYNKKSPCNMNSKIFFFSLLFFFSHKHWMKKRTSCKTFFLNTAPHTTDWKPRVSQMKTEHFLCDFPHHFWMYVCFSFFYTLTRLDCSIFLTLCEFFSAAAAVYCLILLWKTFFFVCFMLKKNFFLSFFSFRHETLFHYFLFIAFPFLLFNSK